MALDFNKIRDAVAAKEKRAKDKLDKYNAEIDQETNDFISAFSSEDFEKWLEKTLIDTLNSDKEPELLMSFHMAEDVNAKLTIEISINNKKYEMQSEYTIYDSDYKNNLTNEALKVQKRMYEKIRPAFEKQLKKLEIRTGKPNIKEIQDLNGRYKHAYIDCRYNKLILCDTVVM